MLSMLTTILAAGLVGGAAPDAPEIHPAIEPVGHAREAYEHAQLPFVDEAPRSSPQRATGRRLAKVVYGYLPYWTASTTTLRWDWLSHVSYFEAPIGADGLLTSVAKSRLGGETYSSLRTEAAKHDTLLTITFTNFVKTEIAVLVGAKKEATIKTIVDAVVQYGAKGANVDFEFVPAGSRAAFTSFMGDLTTRLHAAIPGSHVTSATPMIDWSEAYDEGGLAEVSDGLMVMVYGCAWGSAPKAQPLAPLDNSALWGRCSVGDTMRMLLANVPEARRDRIIVGLPWYGHLFPTASSSVGAARSGGTASSSPYHRCEPWMTANGKRWDADSSTSFAVKAESSGYTQAWCDDADSFLIKLESVRDAKVAGIGLWALGYDGDGDALWAPIRDVLGAPINQPPVADAGPDRSIVAGQMVGLDGTNSRDPEGAALKWTWTVVESPAPLVLPSTPAPVFTPGTEGRYVVRLVVSDGELESVADEVVVNVSPAPEQPPRGPLEGSGGDAPVDDGCGCAGGGAGLGALLALVVRRRRSLQG